MKRNREGFCRLCGRYQKLSFEHIPPKSAFNERPRVFRTMQDMLQERSHSKFRAGVGEYSLCERCNNQTGAWYGNAFVEWSEQGMVWIEKLGAEPLVDLPFYIRPLNVLKQILTMAVAMSSEQALDYHHDLRLFLLNPEQRYLPSKYRVHAYFNRSGQPRFAAGMAIMKIDSGSGSLVEAEVAMPPFGYALTKPIKDQKSLPDYHKLYDLTWFATFDYNIWTRVHLRLPVLETHEPLPLDYRTKSEGDEHYRQLES